MGAEGLLIVLVILIGVGYFYGTQIMDSINSITNNAVINAATSTTNKALQLKGIQAGQQLCSLKVVFNPTLQVPSIASPSASSQASIPNGASSINWYSCHVPTLSLLMLIPLNNPTVFNALIGSPTPG